VQWLSRLLLKQRFDIRGANDPQHHNDPAQAGFFVFGGIVPWRCPMYGLTDDIVSYREDIEYLQEVVKTLLAYAPMDVRKAYVAALKAKQLLPKGVKTK
jgi:hypothetical protein